MVHVTKICVCQINQSFVNKFSIVRWSVWKGGMLDHLAYYEALKSGALPHLETSH